MTKMKLDFLIYKNKTLMKNKWEKDNLKSIISNSFNKLEVLNKLKLKPFTGNYDTLNRYIIEYKIDISHFNRKIGYHYHCKMELKEILVEKSSYSNRACLKKRLYSSGLKAKKCEMCGQGEEWNGMIISLILDHINGINNDNRLENLRIICPNCNAGLETHCGKNIKKNEKKCQRKEKKKERKKYYCECGKEIRNRNKNAKCIECYNISQRKVINRPDKETLLKEIKELGYSGTGRKYGVSDNAIRKWIKNMPV